LTFGGAFAFFEAFLQVANGLLKLGDVLAKLLILEEQLLVRNRVHADLDSDEPRQLYEIIAIFRIPGKTALNNHRPTERFLRGC